MLKQKRLTKVEVEAEKVFGEIERLAVGKADDESKWLAATQYDRLRLPVHQLEADRAVLGGVVLGVEVDFVNSQDGFARFRHGRNF